jgi:hypothetical protein
MQSVAVRKWASGIRNAGMCVAFVYGRDNMKSTMRFLCAVITCTAFWAPLNAQSDDPPARVARLSFLSGSVSFEPSGESQWNQASANYPLSAGDRLFADRGGEAEFETGNVAVRLSGDTDVTVTNLSDQLIQLGLAEGVMRLRAYNLISGNSIEVDTPNAALTLLRNGNYRIESYANDDATFVVVNSGDLEISGNGIDQTLHSGQAAKLTGSNPVRIAWATPPGYDSFDNWCNDRDRRFVNSASQQYVGGYVPGYYELDQYGSWTTVAAYGPVWYPAGVPGDWVPYRYGRWAWVEPWGWTWIEEEPWGFAPFHYGRWAFIGARWGWIPGEPVIRPVYAPALVAFVGHGISIAVSAGPPVAWFPLGPREPYFPWYHHTDTYLRQVNVTNVRNVTNITTITNVTNVRNITYVNRTVATTAVSSETFRRGEPVERQAYRVDRDRAARAEVIPHPDITPETRAIAAGTPQMHPPVETRRPEVVYRPPIRGGNPQEQAREVEPQVVTGPRPGNNRELRPEPQAPPETRNVQEPRRENPQEATGAAFHGGDNRELRPEPQGPPETRNVQEPQRENRPEAAGRAFPERGASQPEQPRPQPPSGGERNDRPLFTRNTPPPQQPAFEQRQPAIEQHPGRPLEPQQVQNIREGRPAGPPRDQEFPPHQQAAARPAPARPAQPQR